MVNKIKFYEKSTKVLYYFIYLFIAFKKKEIIFKKNSVVQLKVVRLMDEVESLFTQHFANNDRKKAMKFLRPQQHKDSHVLTFFVGNFLSFVVSEYI